MSVSKPMEQLSRADVHTTDNQSSHGWLSDTINEAWSGIKGGARVGEGVVTGFVKHVVAHPLETAAEVGAGVVAAGAIAEAGIGVVGATAIAAVPLAAYGTYRGINIASTEGIGAIPGHLKQTYNDAMSTASSVAKAIGAVYNGAADTASMAKVESIGDAATPFIAGGIGGSSTLLGRQLIRGAYTGLELLADQMIPRTPQLVPVFVNGLPKLTTSLSGLGDVPLASTTSLAVGDGSLILHSKSTLGDGLGDAPGEKGAPRAADPGDEAWRNAKIQLENEKRIQMEKAGERKAEAAARAEKIANDPEAKDMGAGKKTKITEYDGPAQHSEASDHVIRVEERSTGLRVTDYHTEYPIIMKQVVDAPDGTRTTFTSSVIDDPENKLRSNNSPYTDRRVYIVENPDGTRGEMQILGWDSPEMARAHRTWALSGM